MDRRGSGADEVNAAAAEARAEARAEAKKAKDQWRIENPLEAIAELEAEVEEITKKYDKWREISLGLLYAVILPMTTILLMMTFLFC
jgi:post-segregation antitoxin (ccd killing protein)